MSTAHSIAFPGSGLSPRAVAPIRLTRRGRLVTSALVVLLLVGGLVGVVSASVSAVATSSASSTQFEYVTVQSGESLWRLAEVIAPKSDPRDVIVDIVRLNNLSDSSVQAGQRLAIPTAYSD